MKLGRAPTMQWIWITIRSIRARAPRGRAWRRRARGSRFVRNAPRALRGRRGRAARAWRPRARDRGVRGFPRRRRGAPFARGRSGAGVPSQGRGSRAKEAHGPQAQGPRGARRRSPPARPRAFPDGSRGSGWPPRARAARPAERCDEASSRAPSSQELVRERYRDRDRQIIHPGGRERLHQGADRAATHPRAERRRPARTDRGDDARDDAREEKERDGSFHAPAPGPSRVFPLTPPRPDQRGGGAARRQRRDGGEAGAPVPEIPEKQVHHAYPQREEPETPRLTLVGGEAGNARPPARHGVDHGKDRRRHHGPASILERDREADRQRAHHGVEDLAERKGRKLPRGLEGADEAEKERDQPEGNQGPDRIVEPRQHRGTLSARESGCQSDSPSPVAATSSSPSGVNSSVRRWKLFERRRSSILSGVISRRFRSGESADRMDSWRGASPAAARRSTSSRRGSPLIQTPPPSGAPCPSNWEDPPLPGQRA